MPGEDTVAIVVWAGGLLVLLAGILVTIARLAVYRHTGEFEPPYVRGIAPMLIGLCLLSVAAYLLGVREGLVVVWGTVAAISMVFLLVRQLRR